MKFNGYEVIVQYLDIGRKGDIEVHSKKIDKSNRHCIFCCKSSPDVTFSKVAHAIPETMGNKSLFSHFECDQCNEEFGAFFEDSLGKYLFPFKLVSQIYGKKNKLISKDKIDDKEFSYGSYLIQTNKNIPVLEGMSAKGLIVENTSSNILSMTEDGFTLNIHRQHYIPERVYCAFLKMAYSLLPLELYPHYLKRYILLQQVAMKKSEIFTEEEKKQHMEEFPNCGVRGFLPGINPYNGINAYLFQKKDDISTLPSLIFYIEMGNFSFAIPVLADDEIGDFKLPKIELAANEGCSVLIFNTEEPVFECSFSALKLEISESQLMDLEKWLKQNNPLK